MTTMITVNFNKIYNKFTVEDNKCKCAVDAGT